MPILAEASPERAPESARTSAEHALCKLDVIYMLLNDDLLYDRICSMLHVLATRATPALSPSPTDHSLQTVAV
jgi:hypothetical protein